MTCPRCGIVFETNHPQAIYCPECRPEMKRERAREHQRKMKMMQGPKEPEEEKVGVHYCDTQERIVTCLTCPLPPEMCFGTVCKRLAEVPGHKYQRRERRGRNKKG